MGEAAHIVFNPELIDTPPPRKRKDAAPKSVPLEDPVDRPYTPSAAGTTARRAKDIKTIEDGLTQAFAMAGLGLSMWNLYDGMVIGENAEKLAQAWTKVAERNPTVKKYLLRMLSGGDWAGAIMITSAVIVPIAANHGLVDNELIGLSRTLGVKLPTFQEIEPAPLEPTGKSNANGNTP